MEIMPVAWRWGVVVAFVLLLLALWPQLALWRLKGPQWADSYFSYNADEAAYTAYVNSLRDGRPRRNDPYSGRDDRADAHQPESIFSIQFVPAYVVALPARAIGISAHTAFILLSCLIAFFSALVIYCLIAKVTGHEKAAAAGVLMVLCCGSLARAPVVLRLFNRPDVTPLYFPFLRSYLPSLPFPFFFLF